MSSCLGGWRHWNDATRHSKLSTGSQRSVKRAGRENDQSDITSSQCSPECSPPCQGGDRGFKSHRGRFQQDGAVRNPEKRRSSNLHECLWVRLPPVLLTTPCVGNEHWRAQVAVTHPPKGCGGSTPSRRTDNMARSSSGSGCWPLKPATRVQIPYGLLTQQTWPSGGTW
jgi:hypothetical protein